VTDDTTGWREEVRSIKGEYARLDEEPLASSLSAWQPFGSLLDGETEPLASISANTFEKLLEGVAGDAIMTAGVATG
jgi:hypothetical protein